MPPAAAAESAFAQFADVAVPLDELLLPHPATAAAMMPTIAPMATTDCLLRALSARTGVVIRTLPPTTCMTIGQDASIVAGKRDRTMSVIRTSAIFCTNGSKPEEEFMYPLLSPSVQTVFITSLVIRNTFVLFSDANGA
jgi:hypothetical protein